MRALLAGSPLATVCQEAHCPNQWECFARKTATFLLLGDRCTRNCRFCAVRAGTPLPPDPEEIAHLSAMVKRLGLRHVVLTSVTRDDLADGGAAHFADAIISLHRLQPRVTVEVLIPDFQGDRAALTTVVEAVPEVIGHNMETIARLYPVVRPQASYRQSLQVLAHIREMSATIATKSGVMLGLGETEQEIDTTLHDLRAVDCELLTLGQYLQPSPGHLPVVRYLHPDEFGHWQQRAMELGFRVASCGPFVRSSYKAAEMLRPA